VRRLIGRLALVLGALAGAPGFAGGLFWQVSDRQGALCGHLLGTVHLCDRGCYPLPPAVLKAFDAAGTLVLELDPGNARMGAELMRAGRLPDGSRLDAMLPRQDAERLAAAIRIIGAEEHSLQRMRPWLAASVLAVGPSSNSTGGRVGVGIDMEELYR